MRITGRRETQAGQEVLVMAREFRAGIEDVWAAVSDPERMQRWIGTWGGDPASGSIAFRMTAEGDDVPEEVYDIETCEPPRRFAVRSREAAPFSADGSGERVHWALRVDLAESNGVTTLTFVQALAEGSLGADMVASVGPGWEYYLDRLAAAIDGADVDAVTWGDYESGSADYRRLFSG